MAMPNAGARSETEPCQTRARTGIWRSSAASVLIGSDHTNGSALAVVVVSAFVVLVVEPAVEPAVVD